MNRKYAESAKNGKEQFKSNSFSLAVALLASWWLVFLSIGCNKVTNATHHSAVMVASLVPAATDLIVAMGASDHLVAVSNYDSIAKLPRVGDYQTTDWETLAVLKPTIMIIEMDPGRLPAGFAQKASGMGIKLVDVRLNTLADILDVSRRLGDEIRASHRGKGLAEQISSRIDACRKRAVNLPRVRTLLTLDERGEHLVGVGEFLNDALIAAGGENLAASMKGAYPTADPETLAKLKPDVVIILKPGAAADTAEKAKQFWSGLGASPRVLVISEPYALLPGSHIADIAEKMSRFLHPDSAQ